MIRRTSSKRTSQELALDGLCYEITLVGGVLKIVVLPLIECHYFFHAVAGGGDFFANEPSVHLAARYDWCIQLLPVRLFFTFYFVLVLISHGYRMSAATSVDARVAAGT